MSGPNYTVGLVMVGIMALITSSHAPFWPCLVGTFCGAFILLVGLDRLTDEGGE